MPRELHDQNPTKMFRIRGSYRQPTSKRLNGATSRAAFTILWLPVCSNLANAQRITGPNQVDYHIEFSIYRSNKNPNAAAGIQKFKQTKGFEHVTFKEIPSVVRKHCELWVSGRRFVMREKDLATHPDELTGADTGLTTWVGTDDKVFKIHDGGYAADLANIGEDLGGGLPNLQFVPDRPLIANGDSISPLVIPFPPESARVQAAYAAHSSAGWRVSMCATQLHRQGPDGIVRGAPSLCYLPGFIKVETIMGQPVITEMRIVGSEKPAEVWTFSSFQRVASVPIAHKLEVRTTANSSSAGPTRVTLYTVKMARIEKLDPAIFSVDRYLREGALVTHQTTSPMGAFSSETFYYHHGGVLSNTLKKTSSRQPRASSTLINCVVRGLVAASDGLPAFSDRLCSLSSTGSK